MSPARSEAIRTGLIRPGRDPDSTPQRWLEAGEVLRRAHGVDVVARYEVPPTLRLLPSDLRNLRKAGFRV
jgi:hypothetical protein